jgi:DNA repair protein RadD
LVLDFAGNVLRHGPVDTVDGGEEKKQRLSGEAPAKMCPECRTLVAPATQICPSCGFVWPPPRIPKHDRTATTLAPLSADLTPLIASEISVAQHYKPGRPPSLRIDFTTEVGEISDWLAFEHSDGARWHAAKKWRALGGSEPVPITAEEAITRQDEITDAPITVTVQREGKYWRVVSVIQKKATVP